MELKCIYIIAILILSFAVKQDYSFKYHKIQIEKEFSNIWDKESSKFFIATQTGTKRGLKKITQTMKEYGIIHILTPSGIHLASLTMILRGLLPKSIFYFFFLLFSLYISSLDSLYSLKRITYFTLTRPLTGSNKLSFFLTFFLDILLGGFQQSPMSFALSLLFWGTIVFSKAGILRLNVHLFICQLSIAAIFDQKISFLSFIINPIITSIFSLTFPLMNFHFWTNSLSALDHLSMHICEFFILFISSLNYLHYSLFIPSSLIIFIFLFSKNLKSGFISYIILFHPNLNQSKENFKESSIYLKGNCKLYFYQDNFYEKCKKKPRIFSRLL